MANPSDFSEEEVNDKVTINKEHIESLGFKLHNKFTENETLRGAKELEWLEDLRMLNGQYDPDILARIGTERSQAYPKIVKPKKKSFEAKLHDICFPDVGKAWSIDATPEPEMSDEDVSGVIRGLINGKKMQFEQQVLQTQQAGTQSPEPPKDESQFVPSPEEVFAAIKALAKKKCTAMEREIEDQFVDIKYTEVMKKAMDAGLGLGTGIIKGPTNKYIPGKKWKRNESNVYFFDKTPKPKPHLEFVRVWDFYPDMTVSEIDQCEGFFERHPMTKHEVRKLAKREDFTLWKDIISDYLTTNPNGDCQFKSWELTLQQIDVKEGGEIPKGNRYEVLEYWGYVDARELEEVGVTLTEDQKNIELQVNIWILGKQVIKAVLNPTPKEEQPYHAFYLEKDETSVFGKGLARIMRDTQINLCAAVRMIYDNGAICAGPQIEVNVDLIDDEQDIESVKAFKIWAREGKDVSTATAPGLRVYNIDSHIDEYLKIVDMCLKFSDLETALPSQAFAEPQSSGREPAQTASIKASMVNITIKDVAKSFDAFISEILEGIYAWNMEFNEREDIKGDFKVQAKGLSSLISKEVRANVLENLTTTVIPRYESWVKEYEYLQEIWKALDLPLEVLRTEEEHNQYIKETSNPKVMELQLETLEAELAELKAKTLNYIATAKKKNVDAVKVAMEKEKAA